MRMRRKVPGGLTLFHDRYGKNYDEYKAYTAQFDEALRHNEAMRPCLSKACSCPPRPQPAPSSPHAGSAHASPALHACTGVARTPERRPAPGSGA